MFGKNLKLKPDHKNGEVLKVHSIFGTFQGEGPYTGYPSIFIRLSGCNLACSFCDTEFESYKEMSVEEIIIQGYKKFEEFSQKLNDYKPLIVITGGEPMRQNITPLCINLLTRGHAVQIESNGTIISPQLPQQVKIVCSPKPCNEKYYRIRPDILKQAIAVKFLISQTYMEYMNIYEVGQTDYNIPVYVQPMDEYDQQKNSNNLKLAMKVASQNGAILSLQTHKIIGIE